MSTGKTLSFLRLLMYETEVKIKIKIPSFPFLDLDHNILLELYYFLLG